MFEKMLGMVKDEVANAVGGMSTIPQAKQGAVVETTANSLMNGLKQYANPASLGALLEIGGVAKGAAGGSSKMMSGLSSGVVGDLTSKLGLTPAVAQSIAASVIPAVMSLFKKHVDDPAQPEFNLQSIVGSLTGASDASGGSGGGLGSVLSGLGSLFGKK